MLLNWGRSTIRLICVEAELEIEEGFIPQNARDGAEFLTRKKRGFGMTD